MSIQIEKDWTTPAGLRAIVVATDMGHRCGYVGVPPGHPLHGVEYNQPSRWLKAMTDDDEIGKRGVLAVLTALVNSDDGRMQSPEMVFDVHGSLTFSGEALRMVDSDLWWFGYDCAHAWDAKDPALMSDAYRKIEAEYGFRDRDSIVRTLDYCTGECESLARQIVEKVRP